MTNTRAWTWRGMPIPKAIEKQGPGSAPAKRAKIKLVDTETLYARWNDPKARAQPVDWYGLAN